MLSYDRNLFRPHCAPSAETTRCSSCRLLGSCSGTVSRFRLSAPQCARVDDLPYRCRYTVPAQGGECKLDGEYSLLNAPSEVQLMHA